MEERSKKRARRNKINRKKKYERTKEKEGVGEILAKHLPSCLRGFTNYESGTPTSWGPRSVFFPPSAVRP